MDVVFKVTINPNIWTDSKASLNINVKGIVYDYARNWRNVWIPGTYNLNATLKIINIETPNSR